MTLSLEFSVGITGLLDVILSILESRNVQPFTNTKGITVNDKMISLIQPSMFYWEFKQSFNEVLVVYIIELFFDCKVL